MSSLLRIRQLYPRLALNERRLADFLLSQPDRARHLSSQKLAEESGVSQSSVVKFAQKLGYKGFPALKLALSESLADRDAITVHNHILSDDPLKVVGEKLLTEKISAIRATLDINSEEKLTETLQLLKNANRILLVGIGASGLVARKIFRLEADEDWHQRRRRAGHARAAGQRSGDGTRRCAAGNLLHRRTSRDQPRGAGSGGDWCRCAGVYRLYPEFAAAVRHGLPVHRRRGAERRAARPSPPPAPSWR